MMIYRALCTLVLLVMMTSQAVAEEVCLDGNTVTGIKDLVVDTQEYGRVSIDVDFRYTTGYEIYGTYLDQFPFYGGGAGKTEDSLSVHQAINAVLNTNNPVPDSAGQSDQTVYFTGLEKVYNEEMISAIGSEISDDGLAWGFCTSDNGCQNATAELNPDERFTYADLSKADGTGCGDAPPPSFSVTPGISGSWYDVTREGEGFNIEIGGSTLDPYFLTYFYTYDETGNQMWLTGLSTIEGDTAVVPMTVTSGAVFGPGFDPNDVIYEPWGTITFKFSSCSEATADYVSTNFGSGSFNLVHITGIAGLSCP